MTKKRQGMIESQRQEIDAARFNALVQNLGDLVTLHDAAGVILYATPSTARLLGYPEEQLVGMNAFSLIHPDDIPAVQRAFTLVVNTLNRGEPTEYRVRRSDGVWVDVETIGTNLLSDPAIGGIILTSRIITERKQHERQLEAITAVAAALRTAPTRAELLPIILEQVIRVLAVDGAALVLRSAAADQPVVALGRGRLDNWTGMGQRLGDDITEQVIGTGQAYRSSSAVAGGLFPTGAELERQCDHPVAAACLPLKVHDQTIGAIWVERSCLGRDAACAITDEQVRLLNAIAEMSGNAVHRATLADQTERRLHRLMVLQAIDMTVSRSLDLRLSLDLLLGEITSRLHIDAADVFVMDAARNELKRAVSRGFTTDFIARSNAGQELARRTVLERRTLHVGDSAGQGLPPEVRPIMDKRKWKGKKGER
jgi:PAS domain S-box-containing protein